MSKRILLLALVWVFLLLVFDNVRFIKPISANPSVIRVPQDYPLIQWAINAANPGDTILVFGYQREWVTVNKTLNLVGDEDAGVDSITISAPKVNVTDFKTVGSITIIASEVNVVHLKRVGSITIGDFGDKSKIINNTIWGSGITLDASSTDNVIMGNRIIISKDFGIGIHLKSSANHNSIVDNVIADTGGLYSTGLKIEPTPSWQGYNNISYNTFYKLYTGIEYHGDNNVFHHNNFIAPNDWRARWFNFISPQSYGINTWDNGTVGNYWSDYNGRDVNGDGVGDTYLPHHEVDDYPLIKPWDTVPPKATKIEFRDSESNLVTNNTVVEESGVRILGDGHDNTVIISYEWDFGDNITEKGSTPDIWAPVGGAQHTYDAPGTYNVSLTVWDLGGNNDTISATITVLRDTDGDGTADLYDPDDDGDGVIDSEDVFPLNVSEWLDTDRDGIGNNADIDDDNDGIPDAWEIKYGLNPLDPTDASVDSDNDGLTNLEEYQKSTNPKISDVSLEEQGSLWWIGSVVTIVAVIFVAAFLFFKRKKKG